MAASNIAFKILYALGLHRRLLSGIAPQAVTILSLHRVTDEPDFFWQPTTPTQFKQLVAYISKRYQVITLGQMQQPNTSGKPRLVFSFDDGYKDFIDNALPILAQYKLPANHNIVTGFTGTNHIIWTQQLNIILNALRNRGFKGNIQVNTIHANIDGSDAGWMQAYNAIYLHLLQNNVDRNSLINALATKMDVPLQCTRLMNWQEIQQCAAAGVEIGSHTATHPVLNFLSEVELEQELAGSRKIIEEKVSRACRVLAFPNGEFNDKVVGAAKKAGYLRLLTTEGNLYTPNAAALPLVSRMNIPGEPFHNTVFRMVQLQARVKAALGRGN